MTTQEKREDWKGSGRAEWEGIGGQNGPSVLYNMMDMSRYDEMDSSKPTEANPEGRVERNKGR